MHEGYWDFGGYEPLRSALADQYLDEGHFTHDVASFVTTDGEFPGVLIRGLSLDEARAMPWNFIVATLQDNQWGFHRFAEEHGARFIEAVGNTNQWVDWGLDPLVLMSSEMPIVGRGVRYHQEMEPIASTYRPPAGDGSVIRSFVNLFPALPCAPLFDAVRAVLPERWRAGVHGIDCPGGIVKPIGRIADMMAESTFGWHDKVSGDGYGHVLHMWAAIGRPIVGHGHHYTGKQGEVYWRHDETCIDLDRVTPHEAAAMIEAIASDPDRHVRMCEAIRATYDAAVDHDKEERAIRELLA